MDSKNNIDKLSKIIIYASKNEFNLYHWMLKNNIIEFVGLIDGIATQLLKRNYYKLLLLDKEFAKCFFGVKTQCERFNVLKNCGDCDNLDFEECEYQIENWQRKWVQLILEDDLINFYYDRLEK